jgi:hypothetical protein
VLYHRTSSIFKFESHQPSLHGIEELLLSSGIPYNVLFSEEMPDKISGFKLVILPDVRAFSDRDAGIFRRFVKEGGKLLILGQYCGRYDEHLRIRMDSALEDVSGVSVFDKLAEPHVEPYGKGLAAAVPTEDNYGAPYINMMSAKSGTMLTPDYLKDPKLVLNVINQLLPDQEIKITACRKLGVSWAMIENRMVLQLLSYADGKEGIGVKVAVAKGKVSNTVMVYRSNASAEKIKGEVEGSYIVFNVCGFSRHAALVFS